MGAVVVGVCLATLLRVHLGRDASAAGGTGNEPRVWEGMLLRLRATRTPHNLLSAIELLLGNHRLVRARVGAAIAELDQPGVEGVSEEVVGAGMGDQIG